ncbi:MAG: PDZ domain-containing protein [Phycisphaerales bacterium]|nr:PDZ domain-containing protein [Phycisphaerales bacterium]
MALFDSGVNLLLVVLGFGILIAVHEFGHFIAAKWANVRVDAFAIGMGPVVASFRKGVGVRIGSTERAVKERCGRAAITIPRLELDGLGISETEYSLRLLPLGGFVRMLGQDDLEPNATSHDPRSYSSAPIWKRMVIVSAGVACNLILAIAMFVAAFMIGVRFDAPVVGTVVAGEPADIAGIRPGDTVISIDGTRASTFADLQIAAAMSKPATPLAITLLRTKDGVAHEVRVSVEPEQSAIAGMRTIGVAPAASTALVGQVEARQFLYGALERAGFWDHTPDAMPVNAVWGVTAATLSGPDGSPPKREAFEAEFRGGTLLSVGTETVATYESLEQAARVSGGNPLATRWRLDGIGEFDIALNCVPSWQPLIYTEKPALAEVDYEVGIMGLSPLVRIGRIPAASPATGLLAENDVILRAGEVIGPRLMEFRITLAERAGESVTLRILRQGAEIECTVPVRRDGKLGVEVASAWDIPLIARPFARTGAPPGVPTPVAPLELMPLTRIDEIDGHSIGTWADIFRALTGAAAARSASVAMRVTDPIKGATTESVSISFDPAAQADLARLSWRPSLGPEWFSPAETLLEAHSDPFKAVVMGFSETKKVVLMTYLTLDRLFRGTVGVSQLRGPVGILHIGARIAPRGVTYLVFFLAMISVNLAVINFLPIPIADGGLIVFLLYEKLRGRPPSTAFQSGALVTGVVIVGLLFAVTFYNDVMRLVG